MKKALEHLILKECKKHIRRHEKRLATDRKNQRRFEKRTGLAPGVRASVIPPHWSLNPQFDPYYVRSRASCIADAIAKKIRARTYRVLPCFITSIPKKKGGGVRRIAIFSIADSAVAKYLYNLLYRRNSAYLSSYAFAYRPERNVHNAVEHLYEHVKGIPRSFIVEYDFSKFFDSIKHDYVIDTIGKRMKVSEREIFLIKRLLTFRYAEGSANYASDNFSENTVGIPQGSTISLFLANVACMELDQKIEREGGRFARYSDDSVILCDSYEKAHKCANHMISHGKSSGTEINFRKSDGVSLLTYDQHSEIKAKSSFDFCGHNISSDRIGIRDSTLRKIKTKISLIINRHLILYPKRHGISTQRFDAALGVDWDLVTCINELRTCIYGRISEHDLTNCLVDKTLPLQFTKSATSFYPLVTDESIFRDLDGWLVDTLYRALKVRAALVTATFPAYTFPVPKAQLISGGWYTAHTTINVETALPSFYKSWLYTRRLVRVYGIQKFPNPDYS